MTPRLFYQPQPVKHPDRWVEFRTIENYGAEFGWPFEKGKEMLQNSGYAVEERER